MPGIKIIRNMIVIMDWKISKNISLHLICTILHGSTSIVICTTKKFQPYNLHHFSSHLQIVYQKSCLALNCLIHKCIQSFCSWAKTWTERKYHLEPRQYKNDSIQPKKSDFEIAALLQRGKKRANFKTGIFSDWMESFLCCHSSSYIHTVVTSFINYFW